MSRSSSASSVMPVAHRDDLARARHDDQRRQAVDVVVARRLARRVVHDGVAEAVRRARRRAGRPGRACPCSRRRRRRPGRASDATTWSTIGASARHGPHQVAQKSSSTALPAELAQAQRRSAVGPPSAAAVRDDRRAREVRRRRARRARAWRRRAAAARSPRAGRTTRPSAPSVGPRRARLPSLHR